jgi:type I restriction enzyme, S subunit
MEVRKGYKQTEVGVIPEDWEVQSLEGLVDSKQPICYGIVQVGPFTRNGIPVLAIKNINTDYFTNVHRCSSQIEIPYTRSRVHSGDVLISVKGTTGRVGLVPHNFDGNISRDLARLRLTDEDVPEFWFQMLQSETARRNLGVATVGTTRMELSIGILKQVRMPRPPKAEQSAIAAALSDADALIQSMEKLIAKKRNIKQGAMQELLKPKEGWGVKKLGAIVEIKKGQLITKSTRINGNIPVIAGGKTPAYYHNKANRFGKTITISGSGANAGYVAFHNYPIFASDCSTIEESNNYSLEFIFYLLQLLQEKIYNSQTGGAQPHIHPSDLNPISCSIPSVEEQTQIATILSDMDAEISALETKLAKYKQIKQGMMQNLLTGKIRLV